MSDLTQQQGWLKSYRFAREINEHEAEAANDTENGARVTVLPDTHGSDSNRIEIMRPDRELMVRSSNEWADDSDDEEREEGWEEATALYYAIERIAELEARSATFEAQAAAYREYVQNNALKQEPRSPATAPQPLPDDDFTWPSQFARVESRELGRVCDHLQAVMARRDALEAYIEHMKENANEP